MAHTIAHTSAGPAFVPGHGSSVDPEFLAFAEELYTLPWEHVKHETNSPPQLGSPDRPAATTSSGQSSGTQSPGKPAKGRRAAYTCRPKKRPHHVIQQLQEQLDQISQQLQDLTIQNYRMSQQAALLQQTVELREWHFRTLAAHSTADVATITPLVPCIAQLSFEQYTVFYSELFTLLSRWLVDLDKDPFVRRQVAEFRRQFCERSAELVLLNRDLALRVAGSRHDTGVQEPAPEARWMQVVASLQLTPAQCMALTLAYERFAAAWAQHAQLAQHLGQQTQGHAATLQTISQRASVRAKSREVTGVMVKTFDAAATLYGTLLKLVLTDQQWIVAVVQSYPWYVDAIMVCSIVARQQRTAAAAAGSS